MPVTLATFYHMDIYVWDNKSVLLMYSHAYYHIAILIQGVMIIIRKYTSINAKTLNLKSSRD